MSTVVQGQPQSLGIPRVWQSNASIRDDARTALSSGRSEGAWIWTLRLARGLLLVQLLWLVGFSWIQFHRGALTRDFATYNQGAWLIAHGHLDPYDTVLGRQLWRNNGEFIMWPLSLLTYLPPEGLWLLWVQDVAIVGTGWVAVGWISEFLRKGANVRWISTIVVLSAIDRFRLGHAV